ncbi:MAG: hypothetical protein Ct9H300mP28_02110 [Pseudomonadota bacterium]|nr:MAG: hypothetical protein Ct9H300mP28_02110 [Pseudomonadota bacterium]
MNSTGFFRNFLNDRRSGGAKNGVVKMSGKQIRKIYEKEEAVVRGLNFRNLEPDVEPGSYEYDLTYMDKVTGKPPRVNRWVGAINAPSVGVCPVDSGVMARVSFSEASDGTTFSKG